MIILFYEIKNIIAFGGVKTIAAKVLSYIFVANFKSAK